MISHWSTTIPKLGRGRSLAYRLFIPVLVVSLFLLPRAPAAAQDLGLGDVLDSIKNAEELQKFMQDPGSYTKGKMKGQATKYVKDSAFGPTLTGQMQQVLSQTYRAFDALPRKGGVCPSAAQDHAWGVLFDIYSTGITGAFGRIGADLILTIPSAPKIAADLAKEAGKQARQQAEKFLREQLAPHPETYSKKSSKGPCTYAIVAVIDYAAGRYDVVVVADCKCQPLFTRGKSAAVAGWAVRATGKATPTLDDNFVKAKIGRASAKFTPDCNCGGEGGLQPPGGGSSSGLQTPGGAEYENPCLGVDCNAVMQGIAETEENLEKARKAMGALSPGDTDDADKDARDHLGDVLSRLTAEVQARIQEYDECCNNADPSGLSEELLPFFKLALSRYQAGRYYPPKFETKEETDDRGSQANPPADTSEGEYVRGEPTVPPDGSQVLTSEVAFAGGTIVGMVVSPQDTPVANAAVEVGTISGVVVEVQSEEDGSFTAEVPAGATEMLRVAVAGIAETITMNIVTSIPKHIPSMPPSLVEPGAVVDVVGNYPSVELEQPVQPAEPGQPVQPAEPGQPAQLTEPGQTVPQAETRVPMEPSQALEEIGKTPVPTARSLGPGGDPAVTRYRIPQNLAPGPLTTVLTDASGVSTRVETGIFEIVSASIDQNKLTSGQNAEFRYQFNFGPGPKRQHWITVNATGPIKYNGDGKRRPLKVDKEGNAEFVDSVKATKGTPGGKPFNISVTIERQ